MKAGRKKSGGKYKAARKKTKSERTRQRRIVQLGKTKTKWIRQLAGHKKLVSLNQDVANVTDSKGKCHKTHIKNVLETPANRFYARQNILIKGAIILTDLGKARITNRPSQEGTVNAILMKE